LKNGEREIKKHEQQWILLARLPISKLRYYENSTLLKAVVRFHVITLKPMIFFTEIEKNILKFKWAVKYPK
jgi:hypothetical protein